MSWILLWNNFSSIEGYKNLRVLDFGSGFGVIANYLAFNNDVVVVEPNKDVSKLKIRKNSYKQYIDSFDILEELQENSFDLIVCTNVLEYMNSEGREKVILLFF